MCWPDSTLTFPDAGVFPSEYLMYKNLEMLNGRWSHISLMPARRTGGWQARDVGLMFSYTLLNVLSHNPLHRKTVKTLPSFPSYRWVDGGSKGCWLTSKLRRWVASPVRLTLTQGSKTQMLKGPGEWSKGQWWPGEHTCCPQGQPFLSKSKGLPSRAQFQNCQSLLIFTPQYGFVCVRFHLVQKAY